MKVFERYIIKECGWSAFSVVLVLLIILLGNTLVRFLGDIAEGKLPLEVIFSMLGVSVIHYLVILIPVGLYLGIIFGFGRLYKDSEMTALFACGMGYRELYRPILILTLPVVLLTLFLSLSLSPWAAGWQDRIKHAARYQTQWSGIAPGKFHQFNNQRYTVFFESFSPVDKSMQRIFVQEATEKMRLLQRAESGFRLQREAGENPYFVFQDGQAYQGNPGQLDYRVIKFKTYGVEIQQKTPSSVRFRTSARPTTELMQSTDPELRAEWHWRLAIPILCFCLAMLAVPLSHTAPRKGRFARLGTGILLYVIVSNMLNVGRTWLERGVVPDWLGLWWLYAILMIVCFLLVNQRERFFYKLGKKS